MCKHFSMTEPSKVAVQLKALRERANVTVRGMAEEAGMKQNSYTHYEARYKKPYLPRDKVEVFADILQRHGIPRAEVLALAGAETVGVPLIVDDAGEAPEGSAMVPLYDVSASAGFGSYNDTETQIAHIAFNPDYLRDVISASKKDLQVIKVQGESMQPTLSDGDLVMIDRSKFDLNYDGLFVLRFGDSLQVKRVNRSPNHGHVEVISDNPSYGRRDWPVDALDPLGRVLWIGKKV